jgi:class 3 adenylate cyclase
MRPVDFTSASSVAGYAPEMPTTSTVTVMVCDLVGSTARHVRLGEDAADEFRSRFFATVRACIEERGGEVVKNLGDGYLAVFRRSAVDAMSCAQDIHRSTSGLDVDDPPRMRIGLSAGEVAEENGDWFGLPVIEASRLCSEADSSQTLMTSIVRGLVGSRGGFLLTPSGLRTLKGIPTPIETWAVTDGPVTEPPVDEGKRRKRSWPYVALSAGALLVVAIVIAQRDSTDRLTWTTVAPQPETVESLTSTSTTVAPQPEPVESLTSTSTTAAPQLDAVELLKSMALVGTDFGPGYSIQNDVADLSSPNAVAEREAAQATPECGPPTAEAPLPYSTLSSGARIDFTTESGGAAWVELVVMPVEGAAIGYLEAIRRDEGFPTCSGLVALKGLTGAPPGMTLAMENFRFKSAVDGYGDDQVYPASDLVIAQDGTVLLTVEAGTRYSRIGNAILLVNAVSPDGDAFAPVFYERAVTAIEAS